MILLDANEAGKLEIWSVFFAGAAFLFSFIVFIIDRKGQKKQEKAQEKNEKANRKLKKRQVRLEQKQTELLEEVQANELKKGKHYIKLIISSYILAVVNTLNRVSPTQPKIKQDQLTRIQYIEAIKSILDDIKVVKDNNFYTILTEKYPKVVMLEFQLRHELTEQNMKNNQKDEFALNPGTIVEFYELADMLEGLDSNLGSSKFYQDGLKILKDFYESAKKKMKNSAR